MQFDELKSVLDIDNENELILLSQNWEVTKFPITESGHWFSEAEHINLFCTSITVIKLLFVSLCLASGSLLLAQSPNARHLPGAD